MVEKLLLFIALPLAALVFLAGCSTSIDPAKSMVLSENRIGSLRLSPDPVVSVRLLKEAFPDHLVTHGIRSGDSPDFHYFEVTADDGEVLFGVVSFLKNDNEPRQAQNDDPVPVHLLKVVSRRIPDQYGIRVGDRVADIVRARGEELVFGTGHFDVFLGRARIFYNLRTRAEVSPERFTAVDARRENWEIVSISWPTGAWE